MTNAENGGLALAADPQVAVIHQEGRAVLLGSDGVFFGDGHEFHMGKCDFVAARGALVGVHCAAHDERRLLRHAVDGLEDHFADVGQRGDALDDAGAVANDDEADLARGAFVIQPPLTVTSRPS